MTNHDQKSNHLRIDELNHDKKAFLDQLAGLGWEIIDLDSKQHEKNEGIR
jgi:type I restriction enzyme R subunit